MTGFNPADFGRAFDKIQMDYQTGIGTYLAPVFHIVAFLLICYLFISKKKHKNFFNIWFTINYLWILLYVGIYMFYQFYQEIGKWSIVFWGIMPLLLTNILFNWIRESIHPKTNYNFTYNTKWRFLIIPLVVFGFWYPTYIYGHGFVFLAKDLLFSFFGLMPCPTTIVTLGLLTIQYPDVNKGLFNALTLFALWIGTLQILIGYVPDYPLAIVGYYSLILIIKNHLKERRNKKKAGIPHVL
ncbi:MAG: DUF6064 family protein [Firmicutes bacterium]|nr:DUF6064 family protein [Bacillota bacterium]